jgi:type IV secretory pathway VirB2 component (pilin)
MVTFLTWCDPLRKIGRYLNLPDFVFGNCWLTVAVVPIAIFIIWWFNAKLSFRLPSVANFLNSEGKFNQKFFQKNLQKFGKYLLSILDGRIFRLVAIAVIGCLFLSWLFLALEKLPVDSQIVKVISMIESYIEPYLPIAIISLRKLIMDNLGTIFFKSAFIVKFIFGRFVR